VEQPTAIPTILKLNPKLKKRYDKNKLVKLNKNTKEKP